MKSVKPGRGPSMMGALGSAFVGIFGIGWTIMAVSMGAPVFFPIFGIGFVIFAIVSALYNLKNATGKDRFSVVDIVNENEESDPLNDRFGRESQVLQEGLKSETATQDAPEGETNFCPYCGAPVREGYSFCKKCGKDLTE